MADTTFSIELQGLDLPNDLKSKLQSELQSTVLSTIAKTDYGKQLSVEPLPGSSERSFLTGLGPILGFIIRNPGRPILSTERSTGQAGAGPQPIISLGATNLPFGGASQADVLEALYFRPDVRAAIASNSKAFAELLSRNEQAAQGFNQLTAGTAGAGDTERLAPILIYALAVVAGAAVGYWSRK